MAPAFDARDALSALETRAIRDKERLTYNSTLGSVCVFLVVVLGLTLPSPWRVVNGEWSSSLLISLLGLVAHCVLVISVIVAFRCGQVQANAVWEQFATMYLGASQRDKTAEADAPVDRRAALHDVVNLTSLRGASSSLSPVHKTTATPSSGRSFFDPPAVTTVEEGKAYVRRLRQAARAKEANDESYHSSSSTGFGTTSGGGYPTDTFGIYGSGAMLPRVYQASGFDPSLRDTSEEKEEDALTTSSNPQVAWAQLEDVGLAMFMHLYVRNIRRLLACHVKDFVEAFVQNSLELNECGVLADVLLRRVPSQALLCPPTGESQKMTNVSLAEMVTNLKHHPAFVSKTRSVYLFEEHMTFDKYLTVGDAAITSFSSLERQEYVLERLIMLSKDRNLDRFRWDTGAATYKGKPWTEALPTDIDILMNVFCCLMDNLLVADHPTDRPFASAYFMSKAPRRPFTPAMRSRLYFVKTVQRPPHFKVLAKAVVREIVPCEENCFHAIVVYLHALKKQKAGHLDSINMHRLIDQVFDISK